MLQINDLSVSIGSRAILDDVSLTVKRGSIVSVIGSNASGKTTLLNAVAGLIRPAQGAIFFEQHNITGLVAHEIFRRGVSLCQAERQLFPDMSVKENLEMGLYFHRQREKKLENLSVNAIFEFFPFLSAVQNKRAGNLSGGEQKLLAIGRTLLSCPALILLDEPLLGLSAAASVQVAGALKAINNRGAAIIFTEQSPVLTRHLSDGYYLLREGRVLQN